MFFRKPQNIAQRSPTKRKQNSDHNANESSKSQLLEQIANNPQNYFKLIQNPANKRILCQPNNEPMPHWILGLANEHIDIVKHFSADPKLSQTLSEKDKSYLNNNYGISFSENAPTKFEESSVKSSGISP